MLLLIVTHACTYVIPIPGVISSPALTSLLGDTDGPRSARIGLK